MSMRLLVLLSVVALALGEFNLPEKCRNPPRVPVEECCSGYRDFFPLNVLKNCNFEEILNPDGKSVKCEPFECMMKQYDVLSSDNKMNKSKTKDFFAKNFKGEWGPVVSDITEICFGVLDKNKSSCDSRSYSICFIKNALDKCPNWKDTKECNQGRTFVKECLSEFS